MAVVMAVRSSATAKLSLPSSSSSSPSLPSTQKVSSKPQLKPSSVVLPTSTTAVSLLALFNAPLEVKALTLDKDQIVSSLTEVEKTVGQMQEVGSSVIDTTQKILEVVGTALKPAIDVALPIAKQAGEQALKIASPVISEATKKAQEAIQGTGVDTEPVLSAAKTVADAAEKTTKVIGDAKPIAASTVETISSAEPVVIVGTAGALFLTYLLLPPIWSVITFSLRGYKGELTPAQSLDVITTKNYVMIDIRSEKDKDKAGIPRLPSSAKNRMISIPLEELPSKLRGLVRNSKKVEAEIAALKISYLKKISKGSNIIIMDSYSDSAKIVAKTLTRLGFKNTWIVADGFAGRRGWLQSRLGTDSYNFSFAEVLSPSRVIPAAARRFGTTSTKFLPGSE
ncbi:calcium sensing receptor, chloroplastic [Pistacia vera]|uniref:calcium sensing receptor, chloroplastic n=1 Tax=Pistacia vera TaxID=55513 RepID=UPI001263E638|nr:calcium sensing receptor, chloroplastic [Pistacia vera]